jgi:hypothetical protein
MYACPLCGKDSNRRGHGFDDPEQVVSHITGSHDETHRDVRGEDIRDEIEATAHQADGAPVDDDPPGEEPSPDEGELPEPAPADEEQPETSEPVQPSAGVATDEGQPDNDRPTFYVESSVEDDETDDTCPRCGEEMWDGETAVDRLTAWAKEDEGWRRWAEANSEVDFVRACSDLNGCGYYELEGGHTGTFRSVQVESGGGGGGWLVGGLAVVAGLAGLALSNGEPEDSGGLGASPGFGDEWDGY